MNKLFFHHRLNPERFCCISIDISSIKKLITPERNYLAENIIEACEYLKAW
jgi:hypothetical protein